MSFDSQTTIANRHDFTTTFTAEYDSDITNTTIITPTTGTSVIVTGVYFSTEGATSAGQQIKLKFVTSGDTIAVFHPTTTPVNGSTGPIVVQGAVNETIKLTSNLGNGKSYFVAIDYRLE